ncbi:MAG: DUF4450 domain-containing protein, partial [Candidatus Hydrogenedentes bacterium]|nr:DUF4450 domain-containing protein [Candidatus Hydrogenedentota bacterium]
MIFSVGVVLLAGLPGQQALGTAAGRYEPVPGGWRLQLSDDGAPGGAEGIGAVKGDARAHRRPLFPPADKRLVWTEEECKALERSAFRPLVLAYNAPRFLFDFHSAGGLLGHLFVGIVERESGVSAWLHEWREIDVSYVSGMMRYSLSDARFPGARVTLEAAPLAEAAGLILKVKAEGDLEGHDLVWMYGGASAFLTNYNMTAPEFTFSPEHFAKDRYGWCG